MWDRKQALDAAYPSINETKITLAPAKSTREMRRSRRSVYGNWGMGKTTRKDGEGGEEPVSGGPVKDFTQIKEKKK